MTPHRSIAWLMCVIALLAAPQVTAQASYGVAERAVSGGAVHLGDPAVVAVLNGDGSLCTGTLISEFVVLTAAHCLSSQYTEIVFGNDIENATIQTRTVREWYAAEDYNSTLDPVDYIDDIALMVLTESAPPEITPIPIQTDEVGSELIGASVRLVGFGRDPDQPTIIGVKKLGTAELVGLDQDAMLYTTAPNMSCNGDSGGPLLVSIDGEERVLGVVSIGDGLCGEIGRGTRVDTHFESFIREHVERTTNLNGAPGARCEEPWHCTGGVCIPALDITTVSFCAKACATDNDCPTPLSCVLDLNGLPFCQHYPESPGNIGDICADDTECIVGVCGGDTPGEDGVCGVPCNLSVCAPRETCTPDALQPGRSVCIPVPPEPPPPDEGCAVAGRSGGLPVSWVGLVLLGLVRRSSHLTVRFARRT